MIRLESMWANELAHFHDLAPAQHNACIVWGGRSDSVTAGVNFERKDLEQDKITFTHVSNLESHTALKRIKVAKTEVNTKFGESLVHGLNQIPDNCNNTAQTKLNFQDCSVCFSVTTIGEDPPTMSYAQWRILGIELNAVSYGVGFLQF